MSHQGVGFWAAFSDTRLGAIRAERNGVFSEDLKQLIEQAHLFTRFGVGGIERIGPLAQGVDGALETESFDGQVVESGGLLHEGADEVVGNGMHGDLLADHGGGLAAQHVHAEGDFDVAEEEFDGPSAQIEFGEFGGGVKDRIDEGGDHHEGLGSETRRGDRNIDQSQGERGGHEAPVSGGAGAGALFGFLPSDQAVVRAKAFALSQVSGASLIHAHDRVDARLQQDGDVDIGTETSVGEDDIAGEKEGKELSEQSAFMDMQSSFSPMQQGAAGQTETANQFGDREPAAFLLTGRLRESLLITGCIGHGDTGSIDDFDPAAAPELFAADPSLQLVGGVSMNTPQGIESEPGAGAAIGGSTGAWTGLTSNRIPGLDFAEGFAAGALRREHLREEGPEGQSLWKEAPAAVIAAYGGLQQVCRHPGRANLAEL